MTQFARKIGSASALLSWRCQPGPRMKTQHASRATGGFTGWDLLICVVTVVLAAGFLLPMIARPKPGRSKRIACVSNLKQIGLAFRMWSNDNGEKFPMQSSVFSTNGGSMEFNFTGEVWRHYLVLSNELSNPKILVCPMDSQNQIGRASCRERV